MKLLVSLLIFGIDKSQQIKDCPAFTGSGSSIGGFSVGTSPYLGSQTIMPIRSSLGQAAIGSSSIVVGQTLPGFAQQTTGNTGLDTSCCIFNENLILATQQQYDKSKSDIQKQKLAADQLLARQDALDLRIQALLTQLRSVEDQLAQLETQYSTINNQVSTSVGNIGGIASQLGAAPGDSRLNQNLLTSFEQYVVAYGLMIGRWKILEGNGNNFFIKDTKKLGYYRMDKTCIQKMVLGQPSKEPINNRYAAGIGCGMRDIY